MNKASQQFPAKRGMFVGVTSLQLFFYKQSLVLDGIAFRDSL